MYSHLSVSDFSYERILITAFGRLTEKLFHARPTSLTKSNQAIVSFLSPPLFVSERESKGRVSIIRIYFIQATFVVSRVSSTVD